VKNLNRLIGSVDEDGFVKGSLSQVLPGDLMSYVPQLSYSGISRLLKQFNIECFYEHDYIGTTETKIPCRISIKSAAYFIKNPYIFGKYARIRVGSTQIPLNHRGIMAASVDPDTCEVKNYEVFDTSRKEEESKKLTEFINNMQTGQIFIGAVNDDASRHLELDTVSAFSTLGLRGKLLGKSRHSGIMLGVKGKKEGTGFEIVAPAPLTKTFEPGNFPEKMKKTPLKFLKNKAAQYKNSVIYLYGGFDDPQFIYYSPRVSKPDKQEKKSS